MGEVGGGEWGEKATYHKMKDLAVSSGCMPVCDSLCHCLTQVYGPIGVEVSCTRADCADYVEAQIAAQMFNFVTACRWVGGFRFYS